MDKNYEELVTRAMKGDLEAFEELVASKQRDILYIASRYCDSREIEDNAQEALLLMFKNISKLKDPSRFNDWMYSIIKNVCYYRNRRRSDRNKLIEMIPYDPHSPGLLNIVEEDRSEFLPTEFVESQEKRTLIMQEINALPQRYQDCLLLFYFNDMTYAEIADVLDLNVKSVANCLVRAKTALKKRLEAATKQEFIVSVAPVGTIPVLARVFQEDAMGKISQEMCNRVLEHSHHSLVALKNAGEAGSTAVKTKSLLSTKAVVGVASLVTVAGITIGIYQHSNQTPPATGRTLAQEETYMSGVDLAPVMEAKENFIIKTLADMIGTEHEAKLLTYVEDGAKQADWEAFIKDIGATEKKQSQTADELYRLYILEKQDKQLLLITREPNSGDRFDVRYRFGDIAEIPNMLEFILEFNNRL